MPVPPCPDLDPLPRLPDGAGAALAPGHAVLQGIGDSPCYGRILSPPFGLPVRTADGAWVDIERIQTGDRVRACGLDLVWRDREVGFCDGLPTLAEHRHGLLVVFLGAAVAVTADHIFLLADGTLCRADRLAPQDALMGAAGAPVAIDALYTGEYLAGFTRIATLAERPDASLDGHLLDTNGIVSGDYAVQVFARAGALDALFNPASAAAPVVGTPAYVARHGDACLGDPDLDADIGAYSRAAAQP